MQEIDGVGHLAMMTAATEISEALERHFAGLLLDRGQHSRHRDRVDASARRMRDRWGNVFDRLRGVTRS